MKNIFLLVAILVTAFANAQKDRRPNLSPSEKTQRFLKVWTRELGLTEKQQDTTKPIILSMFTKVSALKADTVVDRKVINRAIMSTRKAGMESFKGILTPDQLTIYNTKIQEMKDKKYVMKNDNKDKKENKGKGKKDNKEMKKAAEDVIDNDDLF